MSREASTARPWGSRPRPSGRCRLPRYWSSAWSGRERETGALLGAYGLGLLGVIFVGYLTYLELFVIHAVCTWCATYGLTVVVGWLVAALSLRRTDRPV